jgi:hypothetical protein
MSVRDARCGCTGECEGPAVPHRPRFLFACPLTCSRGKAAGGGGCQCDGVRADERTGVCLLLSPSSLGGSRVVVAPAPCDGSTVLPPSAWPADASQRMHGGGGLLTSIGTRTDSASYTLAHLLRCLSLAALGEKRKDRGPSVGRTSLAHAARARGRPMVHASGAAEGSNGGTLLNHTRTRSSSLFTSLFDMQPSSPPLFLSLLSP